MRLEDCGDMTVAIEFAYALGALINLLRVVGIVREEHVLVVLYLEVEASLHSAVCLHAVLQFFGVTSGELCHCHGSHGVFDIDGYGLSELNALDCLNGRNEVECYLSVLDDDVLGMEVALVAAVVVNLYAFLHVLLHLQVAVDDKCAARLNECGVVAEALEVSLVDVEVVRVCGCDDGHPRTQPME